MNPISELLLAWYRANQRDLPWRRTKDPYAIMVSEIMLQQTRVNTVIDYYHRFLEAFPTIIALANATEDEVLNLWKGLGYYSRARNLHKAAKQIQQNHQGSFPNNFTQVRGLPGIGDYTAGAIMSIAFNLSYAAVDGNVLRVISRIYGIAKDIMLSDTKKEITAMTQTMIPDGAAGDFTQALMELGAVVCVPKKPLCDECPVAAYCCAKLEEQTDFLPIKQRKGTSPVLSFHALLLIQQEQILLTRNTGQTLLKGMWAVPLLEPCSDSQLPDQIKALTGVCIQEFKRVGKTRHVFTHRIWEMDVILAQVLPNPSPHPDYLWVSLEALHELPIPTAFTKVLQWLEQDKQ